MLRYTRPFHRLMTPALHARIERCAAEFPELSNQTITVGLTRAADGIAVAEEMLIRLNVKPRVGVSHFVIGHELTHLLQSTGLRTVPDGEIQCDVWTLARSALFLDDRPAYLWGGWSNRTWPQHARAVRALCIESIERRRTERRYLVWLRQAIREHLARRSSPDRILQLALSFDEAFRA